MSNHLDRQVYSKTVRNKLDALEAKKHALGLKLREVDRQIEELLCGQCPIHVGARITWVSANRERYGRVVAIHSGYNGFSFRVVVTSKFGQEIGSATVTESQEPALRNDV